MDWLKCNICFNTYNDSSLRPRTLSCGHTFCEKCINTTIQNKRLTCPQCRKVHDLESGVEIPINFTLEGILKSLSQTSQDVNEGATSPPFEGKSDTDNKSEIHGSLKSLLDQQEKSLSSQKELLKTSAGICYEHPSKECIHRCSVHKSWVCQDCIEEQGEHPKDVCKIKSFQDEIEDRRQEHKRSLNNEGKFCDETLSVIENHIYILRNEREQHISLINSLQALVSMHKKEEENLQSEIASYENIIEEGKNVKKKLLDTEVTVLNAATLDESNTAREMAKTKNSEARNWGTNSKREVESGRVKVKGSTSLAEVTKMSLDYRDKCMLSQPEFTDEINGISGKIESNINTKLHEVDITRQHLNRITHFYEDELNKIASSKEKPWNMWDIVTKVQVIFLELIEMISDESDEDGTDNDIDDDDVDESEENNNQNEALEGDDNRIISHKTKVYVIEDSDKECSVLGGYLYLYEGNLLLQDLKIRDSLPIKGITLPLQNLTTNMSFPRHVYLTFWDKEKDVFLGDVVISLNEEVPRLAQQFIELCMGRRGSTYSGSSRIAIRNMGKPGEYLFCSHYMDKNQKHSDKRLSVILEKKENIAPKLGLVYPFKEVGFGIITRSDYKWAITGPAIGMVVSGLPVLEKIIQDKLVDARQSKVKIMECGLVIESNKDIRLRQP